MKRAGILRRLSAVFADVLERPGLRVTEKTSAADLRGWDSLAHIALLAETEAAFGIKFTMKEIISLKDVGGIVAVIEREL